MSPIESPHLSLVPGETYRFGRPSLASGDYFFSNDGPIPIEALETIPRHTPGISLHIGDGDLISLLALHQLQPVQADRNPAVITMQKIVIDAIIASDTAPEAREQIITLGTDLLEHTPEPTDSAQSIADNLDAGSSELRLGSLHWSNHFSEVKEALIARPPIHVISDVRNTDFVLALQHMRKQFGDIQLFNATNVHSYLDRDEYMEYMGFIPNLPFAKDVTILTSVRGLWAEFMQGNSRLYSLDRMTMQGIAKYTKFLDLIRFNPGSLVRHLL